MITKSILKKILESFKRKEANNNYELKEVNINQCLHYCCFFYGKNQYNPYESYLVENIIDQSIFPRQLV